MDLSEIVKYILEWMAFFVTPFSICTTSILLFEKIAPRLGFVDKPDHRKAHIGDIPLVGGMAMYLAFALSIAFLVPDDVYIPLLLLTLAVLLTGTLDDYFDLPATARIVIQATIATIMVVVIDIQLIDIGNLYGQGPVLLGPTLGLIFTVVCTVGVINAVNMIDGLDGLAGSITFISILAIAFLLWLSDFHRDSVVLVILLGSLASFLCFNSHVFVKKAKIFMGDAGSMFLGTILCWHFIKFSQADYGVLSPVAAGWIFGLPLMDTVSVMIGRIKNGKSPFAAARDHLHHKLQTAGYSESRALCIMILLHTILVFGGIFITLNRSAEPVMFWLFVILVVLYHFTLLTLFKESEDTLINRASDEST